VKAAEIASPPYDVLSSSEAKEMANGHPDSFLHVIKPEIDFDDTFNPYSEQVYMRGAANLQRLIAEGAMVQETKPCYYIYKLKMKGHEQVGLVAAASVDDYLERRIKEHESTVPEKEDDRVNHIDALSAHTGPVFLMYRDEAEIEQLMQVGMQNPSVCQFIGDHGIENTLYVVDDERLIQKIQTAFTKVNALYVADGHHRSAAAARVRERRRKRNPQHGGDEEYNFFLSVIFPETDLRILEYNRAVVDINGHTDDDFIARIRENFEISEFAAAEGYRPESNFTFGMYFRGQWYRLKAHGDLLGKHDPIGQLDVTILQENLLQPLLGIEDPRTDQRIKFIGGIRGPGELEKVVNSGKCEVAFSMFPTSIRQLLAVADAGLMMPPKSTWFEPKLESGLVVHLLD
jgi:uncharacterized protein (DUF1015 family)